ncbi:hypothetical protein D6783_01935 [Candidatus Woesearchaeota archaeon]|nr:MAG: hypothetical protein D6783_01935 [Candidatus Woesearchaeota archaeon]
MTKQTQQNQKKNTRPFKTRGRQGQGWAVDYSIGLLLFLTVFILGIKIITENFQPNTYDLLAKQAESVSSILKQEGYPPTWAFEPVNNIVRAGVHTNAKLSKRKLLTMKTFSYNDLKVRLGATNDLLFYFTNTTNGIVNFHDTCSFGAPDSLDEVTIQTSNTHSENLPNAALVAPATLIQGDLATTFDTDIYEKQEGQPNNLSALVNNLSRYDVVFLEDPHLDDPWKDLTRTQILLALEEFTKNGGTLILTGNVTSHFLGVFQNTTQEKNHTVLVTDDGYYLTLPTGTIQNTAAPGFTVENVDADNFLKITEYDEAAQRPGIARWTLGDGIIYYYPTIEATTPTGPLKNDILSLVNNAVNITAVDCDSISVEEDKVRDLVNIERITIYKQQPLTMHVLQWRKRP